MPEHYCRGTGKLDDPTHATDKVCSTCIGRMWWHYKVFGRWKDDTESGTCATAYDWRNVQMCNGHVTLSCTEGRLIQVANKRDGVTTEDHEFFKPTYGRTESTTCVYGEAPLLTDIPSNSVCSQEGNVESFVKDRCNGKTACKITRAELDDEIGNSACPLYAKYFKASYRCV